MPLAGITGQHFTMVYDETKYVTAIAILNPSGTANTVTITAYGEDGSVLGSPAQVALPAGSRQAFLLKSTASLAAAVGHYGSLDFQVTAGALGVLGIRANGSAFTSLLPIAQ
jgi:hypothetical protein